MSAFGYPGREFDLFINEGSGETLLAACVTTDVSRPRPEIDTTSKDDDGWRRVLAVPSRKSLDISFTAVATENNWDRLLRLWQNEVLVTARVAHPTGGYEEGSFYLSQLDNDSPEDNRITFTGTLLSSGPTTYVPGV